MLRTAPDSGSAPKAVRWRKSGATLQGYVYGDGSGNQIRFAVEDSVDAFPGGGPTLKEVGPWRTVDWVGWRLLEWNMEKDTVGAWVGDGVLSGELRYDGIQLRHVPGGTLAGRIVIDQVQLAQQVPSAVTVSPGTVPATTALLQNYPNPFNPASDIRYQLSASGHVRLSVYDLLGRLVTTLVDEAGSPGTYTVRFDGSRVASGMYFYRLEAGSFVATRRMLLVK